MVRTLYNQPGLERAVVIECTSSNVQKHAVCHFGYDNPGISNPLDGNIVGGGRKSIVGCGSVNMCAVLGRP